MAYKNKEDAAAYHKVWYQENKEKISTQQKVYREENKEKISTQNKVYHKENKEKIAAYNKIYYAENKEKVAAQQKGYLASYRSTEKGFLSRLYSSCKSNTKKRQAKDPSIEDFNLSQEEFFTLWEEHKAKHGYNCGYYNDEPIIIQATAPAKNGKQNPVPKNLLSVDRLDPEKGYTKENIVFCGWDINRRKNDTKPKDSYQFIRVYEERNQ